MNFYTFLERNYPSEEERIKKLEKGFISLYRIAEAVKALVEEKGNGIWAFIFKNIYKPLFLNESFDVVVGNPPWLVYNRMHSELQRFMKDFLKEHRIALDGHLVSHIDIASVFLISSFLNYLKDNGLIAFVLPYSFISGDQYAWFRKKHNYNSKGMDILKLYDIKDVEPLFNVPACVLIAKKKVDPVETKREIPALRFKGKLPRINASPEEAKKHITKEKATLYLVEMGKLNYWTYTPSRYATSEYAEKFRDGATIYPRSLVR